MNKTISTALALMVSALVLVGAPVNHLSITTDTNNIVNGPTNFWDVTFTDPKFTNDLSGWLTEWWPQGGGGGGGQTYGAGNEISTNGFVISFTGTGHYVSTNTWFSLTNNATDFNLSHYQLSGALGTAGG